MAIQLKFPFWDSLDGVEASSKEEIKRCLLSSLQRIDKFLNFTDDYESPIVKAFLGVTPYTLCAFHHRKETLRKDIAIHFFIHDSKFVSVLNSPYKYIDELKNYRWVIAPDFSVQPQMPLEEKRYNIFNIKRITAWWQYNGINVIPNVVWCSGVDYEYCFDGLPKHSVVAINSTGVGKDERSKQVWIEGYKKAIEVLLPKLIIRYGAKQDGEMESISIYFPNDNRRIAA
jgi:hypothetical protein